MINFASGKDRYGRSNHSCRMFLVYRSYLQAAHRSDTSRSRIHWGSLPEPTYKQVYDGQTGHAEAIRITYAPKKISYWDILEVFWRAHDPTTCNRQGEDIGEQYRSAIFYLNPEQQQIALKSKELIEQSGIFSDPIVTEILPATIFYPAKEEYHQNYYENNTDRGYCIFSIAPKINKIHNLFEEKIKPEYQNLENENRTQETL